jgi:copper chaperone CopZ
MPLSSPSWWRFVLCSPYSNFQTTELKVNIYCDGCEKRVKKILRKINGKKDFFYMPCFFQFFLIIVSISIFQSNRENICLDWFTGVYQSTIDREQGKLTVSGLVDPDTLIKKLKKAGKPAALWEAKPGVAGQPQNLHLGGGDNSQPKDGDGKGQAGGASSPAAKTGAGAGGVGARNENMVMSPQPTPQQMQTIQQQPMPQQLQQHPTTQQMQMQGVKNPPQLMAGRMPPGTAVAPAATAAAKDPRTIKVHLPVDESGEEFDFEDDDLDEDLFDEPTRMMGPVAMPPAAGMSSKGGPGGGGKKGSGGGIQIPLQIKGNTSNRGGGIGKNQGGSGAQANNVGGRNGGGGKPPQNGIVGGAPNGANLPGQGKMAGGPMGGGMPSQPGMRANIMGGGMPQRAVIKPNMMGVPGFSGMGQMGGGDINGMAGGMLGAGFYQGGNGGGMQNGPELMHAAGAGGNNPMAQQQLLQQQHQQMMMGHGGPHVHPGLAGAGYQPMGYRYGRPPMHYPSYPVPPPTYPEPYNIFSDENPNSSCSVMWGGTRQPAGAELLSSRRFDQAGNRKEPLVTTGDQQSALWSVYMDNKSS